MTDSKSFYDSLKNESCPALLPNSVMQKVAIEIIRWIHTRTMLSDAFTTDSAADYVGYVMQRGQWIILRRRRSASGDTA